MSALEKLAAAGGLGSGEIVPKIVEWNGHTFPFFFRDLPGGQVQKLLGGNDVDPSIVVAALCEEDGSPALTMEQAQQLKLGLRAAIVSAAMDVFGFSKAARDTEKKS